MERMACPDCDGQEPDTNDAGGRAGECARCGGKGYIEGHDPTADAEIRRFLAVGVVRADPMTLIARHAIHYVAERRRHGTATGRLETLVALVTTEWRQGAILGSCGTCRFFDEGEKLCTNRRGIATGQVVVSTDFCSRWDLR